MSNELIVNATDSDFEEVVLNASGPVLVDFWAPWCGPCKMIAPVLDALADEYKDRLTIVKVNVDESQKVPSQFGVRGIPTLILFRDGAPAATKVGAIPKSQLAAFVESNL
jgi:thioredoxin 1